MAIFGATGAGKSTLLRNMIASDIAAARALRSLTPTLTELYRGLKERRVEWIAEFNAEDYHPLADEDAPFIRSITIRATRPQGTAAGE
jgi:DNA helicase HerA-like ATPase